SASTVSFTTRRAGADAPWSRLAYSTVPPVANGTWAPAPTTSRPATCGMFTVVRRAGRPAPRIPAPETVSAPVADFRAVSASNAAIRSGRSRRTVMSPYPYGPSDRQEPEARACRAHLAPGQVFTRGTPPRRRVAGQQAGAVRWHS